jgi:hypothetical protein
VKRLSDASSQLVALAAVVFYALTGARDVLWGEPTKLALLMHDFRLDLAQWTHAGSLLLLWPFTKLPLENFAQRTHLASGVMSAIALGFLHATLRRLALAPAAVLVAVVSVAVAHTVWLVSAVAENYAPVLLILSFAAWLGVARRLHWAAGVVLGFGTVAHSITLFGLPAIGLCVWRERGRRAVAGLVLGIALGWAAPTFALSSGDPLAEAGWGSVLERYASPTRMAANAAVLAAFLLYNFAGPALVLLGLGLRALPRRLWLPALLFAAVHYTVALMWIPQRAIFIPTPVYLALAYPIALGAERLLARRPRLFTPALLALVLVPVSVYALAGRVRVPSAVRDIPYRDEAAYLLTPWKGPSSTARRYIEDAGATLALGALVLGDFTLLTPLQYAQAIEGWRPDVALYTVDHEDQATISAEVERALGHGRPVYLLAPDVTAGDEAGRLSGAWAAEPGVERLQRLVPSGDAQAPPEAEPSGG